MTPRSVAPVLLAAALGIAGAGCRSSESHARSVPAAAIAGETTSSAGAVAEGPRQSQGFKARTIFAPQKLLTEAEKKKDRALRQRGDQQAQAAIVPASMQGRKPPGDAVFSIYRDGHLTRAVRRQDVSEPIALTELLAQPKGPGIRAVLVHSENESRWLTADQLPALQLRINRRGLAKVEAAGSKAGRRGGKRKASSHQHMAKKLHVAKRILRQQEVRGVTWIEVRSTASPRLDSEPG